MMNRNVIIASVVGLAVGAGVGYGVGSALTRKKLEGLIDEEVEQVRQRYAILRKDEFPTPQSVMEARAAVDALTNEDADSDSSEEKVPAEMLDQLRNYHGSAILPPEDENIQETEQQDEVETINVWDNVSARKNAAVPEPNPNHPYVITEDQYLEEHVDGFDEYKKIGLQYWSLDDTLTDEGETIVPNIDDVVGVDNLEHFGVGTSDPDAVYIRNEKARTDYEVMRTKQSYRHVVLGVELDRATSSKSPRKMRDDDE